jgi:hypothetical protein
MIIQLRADTIPYYVNGARPIICRPHRSEADTRWYGGRRYYRASHGSHGLGGAISGALETEWQAPHFCRSNQNQEGMLFVPST